MRAFALRLGRLVVVLVVVSFFSFLLLEFIPGDPVVYKAGFGATPEVLDQLREELGFNDPILVRYANWVGDVLQGDLGESYFTEQKTWDAIRVALPKTIELAILAQLIALGIAIPAAITSVRNPGGVVDRMTSAIAFGFLSIPGFVLAVYLVALFAVRLDWFPAIATDIPGLNDDPIENLRQMLLPALALGINLVAVYLRLLRTDLLTTMQQDFVMLAQARGYSERRVLYRHVLRPSSLSLITSVGLNTGGLIGGVLIIESIFAIPGMGRLLVQSIFGEDFEVVQGLVLLFSAAFVLVNFAVDMFYSVVDPRIRRGNAS